MILNDSGIVRIVFRIISIKFNDDLFTFLNEHFSHLLKEMILPEDRAGAVRGTTKSSTAGDINRKVDVHRNLGLLI